MQSLGTELQQHQHPHVMNSHAGLSSLKNPNRGSCENAKEKVTGPVSLVITIIQLREKSKGEGKD